MKNPTVALCLLIAACAPDPGPPPPDCNRTPPLHTLYCEGLALGAWVTYLRVEYRHCTEASATVEVDGVVSEAKAWDRYRVDVGDWALEAAVSPTRVLVTRDGKSETVRNCMEGR